MATGQRIIPRAPQRESDLASATRASYTVDGEPATLVQRLPECVQCPPGTHYAIDGESGFFRDSLWAARSCAKVDLAFWCPIDGPEGRTYTPRSCTDSSICKIFGLTESAAKSALPKAHDKSAKTRIPFGNEHQVLQTKENTYYSLKDKGVVAVEAPLS